MPYNEKKLEKTLDGHCPCCGKKLDPIDYYFHPQSGVLILQGTPILMGATEALIFKELVKSFPRVLSPVLLHERLSAGRPAGGVDDALMKAYMTRLRRRLEPYGMTITSAVVMGGYLIVKHGKK